MNFFKYFSVLFTLIISGCMGSQITDFSDRSVVYGWVDLSAAKGNTVIGGSFKDFNAAPGEDFYPIGYSKMGTGYLVFHIGLDQGPVKLNTLNVQSCAVLCTNVINAYDFGAQGGDVLATKIGQRGVYYLGSVGILSKKGLFAPRNFSVIPSQGPSKREMLTHILSVANEEQKPLIQDALNNL